MIESIAEALGHSISTWDVLQTCGFEFDASVLSDFSPGLSFNFGCLKLSASHVYNVRWAEVVLLGGVLSTPRRIGAVEFEMPPKVASFEQGVAWIAWHLDQNHGFEATNTPAWLEVGRQHLHLLPWVRDLAAYKARPRCTVQREWMRIVLKTLGTQMAESNTESRVTLRFDGRVLTLDVDRNVIAAAAQGEAWPCSYELPVASITRLPRRLAMHDIEISVWNSELRIANRCFRGVVEVPSDPT